MKTVQVTSIPGLPFRGLIIGMAGWLLLGLSGCVWENKEELFSGTEPCDTSMVSFSDDIVPILANNCYSCHSNLNAPSFGGGLSLEDYGDVVRSAERIIGAVNHADGFLPMPQGMDKLDPCPVNLLEAWVEAGPPDN